VRTIATNASKYHVESVLYVVYRMFASLNLEFHTLIVSFVMTVLVSGCVFMYCRTRVSRVEEIAIEQSRIMKNYVAQIEHMRQETVMRQGACMIGIRQPTNGVTAKDNRIHVADDTDAICLRVTEQDEDSYYDDSSDSESVDDSDTSSVVSEQETNDSVAEVSDIDISVTKVPMMTTIEEHAPTESLQEIKEQADVLTGLTKKELCDRIISRNISERSSGTLMKMKRDELISLLESH
jgi:thiamine phosphate synthase YjbQ (UPF0047 family)